MVDWIEENTWQISNNNNNKNFSSFYSSCTMFQQPFNIPLINANVEWSLSCLSHLSLSFNIAFTLIGLSKSIASSFKMFLVPTFYLLLFPTQHYFGPPRPLLHLTLTTDIALTKSLSLILLDSKWRPRSSLRLETLKPGHAYKASREALLVYQMLIMSWNHCHLSGQIA